MTKGKRCIGKAGRQSEICCVFSTSLSICIYSRKFCIDKAYLENEFSRATLERWAGCSRNRILCTGKASPWCGFALTFEIAVTASQLRVFDVSVGFVVF